MPNWRYPLAWLVSLGLIWALYAFATDRLVDNMDRELQHTLDTDTLVLESQASRALDGVISRLEAISALTSRSDVKDAQRFSEKLQDLLFEDMAVRSLSLIDTQGTIVVSSMVANVGRSVSKAALENIGPPAPEPRQGVRFGGSLAQRDLSDLASPTEADDSVQSIWLVQMDSKTADLAGYRWVVAINAGFFQNFWSSALDGNDVQVGLFNYEGQRLVTSGKGPATSPLIKRELEQALRGGESGELVLHTLKDWKIRYRASARHPLTFVMFVDVAAREQQRLQSISAWRWSSWGASLLVTALIGWFYVSARRYEQSIGVSSRLRQEAQTDALTGLANRRAFDKFVPKELARAKSLDLPFSLMVLDLDHFKSINDRFGHPGGDVVLRVLAARWQALLRSQDFIARIGGEEFCVVLPGAGSSQAEAVARKLIEETRREPVLLPGTETTLVVTVSVGVVAFDVCPPQADVASLLAMADSALYGAKEDGRNRYVLAAKWASPSLTQEGLPA